MPLAKMPDIVDLKFSKSYDKKLTHPLIDHSYHSNILSIQTRHREHAALLHIFEMKIEQGIIIELNFWKLNYQLLNC